MSERFWAGKWRKGNLAPCHFCIKYGRGARGQTLKDKFGEKITKKKTVILTWVDAVSVECCRCPQLPPRPRTEQSKTADHSWSSACREPVTVSHSSSSAYWSTGLCRGRERMAQALSVIWEAEPAAIHESGWILTLKLGSFQSLASAENG